MKNSILSLRIAVIVLLAIMVLTSCTSQPPLVGADRDEHGCIASAGYAWCHRESECVHPWELAKAKGISPGVEEFKRYCGNGH